MSDALQKLSPEGLGGLDKDPEGLEKAVDKAFADAAKDVYEYEGKTYTAHPAATVFPLFTGEAFDKLVLSLQVNGMRQPVLLIGDQIVDGRNRFRAAKKAGARIIFKQLDPGEDACVVAMEMNVLRRDLTSGQRTALASTLRRMAMRIAAMRREEVARAGRESREKDRAAAQAAGVGEGGSLGSGLSGTPAAGGSGGDAVSGESVDADSAEAVQTLNPSLLDSPPSALATRAKAAEAAGVSESSIKRFDKVVDKAPELQEPIAAGEMTVADAAVVSEEDPEVRQQAVEDVRAGRARTGAEAIEQRTGRAPKARTRQQRSVGGKAQGDGAAEGMPPLPAVGAVGGKDAASGSSPDPSSASASSQPSRATLPDLAMSPMLLLAGVRKVMPKINLDPCSSEIANGKVRALRYFSREDDGLQQAWDAEDVYVFPPSKSAGRFASKLTGEMFAGRVRRALFLVPSDLSDQDQAVLLRSTQLTGIVYETERTSYDVEGAGKAKAPSRMVLYVFGIEKKELYSAFESWGKVFVTAGRQ